ncbi:peptidase inhibitor family I36 protein [Bailinhaonella thermotolerans]|uniref:Peptidase inhibitor family I36 n=1 Tax=Bailinhaonella thermotolerans TaxID=1070861 RepID=A0A3A4A8N0_9ACTN|nr:peptidase inhibitor family I36 protein [Bailinhaonella thermotolerans]RJL23287.1 hypothetical protein D5H75_33540 [Bailinhaonella thermotolerans]
MRVLRSAIVALAAAGACVLAAELPASACPGGGCSSGRFCLYENNDYNQGNTDHWLDFVNDDFDLRNNYWSGSNDSIDNEASSMRNRRGCSVRLWQHVGGTGAQSTWANGANDGFLANNAIGDNRASAVDVCV